MLHEVMYFLLLLVPIIPAIVVFYHETDLPGCRSLSDPESVLPLETRGERR